MSRLKMDEQSILERCGEYIAQVDLNTLPGWQPHEPFRLNPLAQGEYNLNAILQQEHQAWVLRVNMGSQIDVESQIMYEYQTLRMLAHTGRTPHAYYVDAHAPGIGQGLMIMQYLPGQPLSYRQHWREAAQLLADIHSHTAGLGQQHLLREAQPLSMTYEECDRLLGVFFQSPLAEPALCDYLEQVLGWAKAARNRETALQADPWRCVINTEVNSGNFIFNPACDSLHLVDWEKALWGDPSQDISHFCVPTTTLWKTDVRFSPQERVDFSGAYRMALKDPHLRDTIEDRVRLRDPFNCLRGIAWSAMAWVRYQTGEHALRNEDTFQTVSRYLQLPFLRELFDSYLQQDPGRWV
jgi:aminoglycoside phosphotransferase (APT) family kinase protein